MKINKFEFGHMTSVAAMPVYDKSFKKPSSTEPKDQLPLNLVCSIGVSGAHCCLFK